MCRCCYRSTNSEEIYFYLLVTTIYSTFSQLITIYYVSYNLIFTSIVKVTVLQVYEIQCNHWLLLFAGICTSCFGQANILYLLIRIRTLRTFHNKLLCLFCLLCLACSDCSALSDLMPHACFWRRLVYSIKANSFFKAINQSAPEAGRADETEHAEQARQSILL